MIEELRSGTYGMTLKLPAKLKVLQDGARCAVLVDEASQTHWTLLWAPELHMDLRKEHRADLRTRMDWYARDMFEANGLLRAPDRDRASLRTADPRWSPIVEVSYVDIDGVTAMRMLHRMAYEPEWESVMGHLLLPLRQGLFEARCMCVDQVTGFRESMLVDRILQREQPKTEADLRRLMKRVHPWDLDDPRHDAAFPENVLSRARAGVDWVVNKAGLRIAEPPLPRPEGQVLLAELGCAIEPPPRFQLWTQTDRSQIINFARVSFCSTDGVERFVVKRWTEGPELTVADMYAVAEDMVKAMHASVGITDLRCASESSVSIMGQPSLLVLADGMGVRGTYPDGTPERDARRNGVLFFLDELGRMWALGLFGRDVVPQAALRTELEAAALTFRLTDGSEGDDAAGQEESGAAGEPRGKWTRRLARLFGRPWLSVAGVIALAAATGACTAKEAPAAVRTEVTDRAATPAQGVTPATDVNKPSAVPAPALVWQDRVRLPSGGFGDGTELEVCGRLVIDAHGDLLYGRCDGPQTADDLAAYQLVEFGGLLGHLAAIDSEAGARQVMVMGHGVHGGETWADAAAEWARWVWIGLQEQNVGASARNGLEAVLAAEPGAPSTCRQLLVLGFGLAEVLEQPCSSASASVRSRAWLETSELETLARWRGSLRLEERDGITLYGSGASTRNDADQAAMAAWVAALSGRLLAGADPGSRP